MAPPWYQVGLGVAAFQSGNYDLSAETFQSAPPHINTLAFLPMAEAMHGNIQAARSAAADLQRQIPGFTFDRLFAASLEADPDKRHLFKAARLSGIPITAADLEAPAMPVAGPDADPG